MEIQRVLELAGFYEGAKKLEKGLDPIAEYDIYRHFDCLVGQKTAIYISHRLSSSRFCDKIVVFGDHTIKEYGTHEELVGKENGIYAELFAAQAQYYLT